MGLSLFKSICVQDHLISLLFEWSWLMLKSFSLSYCALEMLSSLVVVILFKLLGHFQVNINSINIGLEKTDLLLCIQNKTNTSLPGLREGAPQSLLCLFFAVFPPAMSIRILQQRQTTRSVILVNCILLNGLKGLPSCSTQIIPRDVFLPILLAVSEG